MSRALTLIAFAISNLFVLFLSFPLTLFNVKFARSQELYSEQVSRNLGRLTNGGVNNSVEIDNNGQQFGDNGNNGATPIDLQYQEQQQLQHSSQNLQLILTKLFPTLKHWSKNSQFDNDEDTPLTSDQTASASANELQEQSSATTLPNLSYVIADNHNNRNHQYHQLSPSNINLNETSTNDDSPIRQLISAHSNALFYPPTEQQLYQANQQQLPTKPYLNTNYNLPNAHYSDLTLQTQQSFLPTHLQPFDSNKPPLYQYKPQPAPPTSFHHYSIAPQTQILPSKLTTTPAAAAAATTNLIAPYTNLLHPISSPISSSPSSTSHLQQPYHASFKPFYQEQQQQQYQQKPELSQQKPQSASHLSSMLAFLANNKANLSNLIQLLPLVAQTISILPKVFSTPAGSVSSSPISVLTLPTNYLDSPTPSKSNPSILSLIQSSTSSSSDKNSNATDKLTERFQQSSTDSPTIIPYGDNQATTTSGGSSSIHRLQNLFSNPILTQILPQIAKQLVFASLNQQQHSSNPSTQYEFPGLYQPDAGYTMDSMTSSSPTSPLSSLSPSSLSWIKGLIGSLASAQRQHHSQQKQVPLHRTSWHHSTPETNHHPGSELESVPNTSGSSSTTSWLDSARPVSQIINSWLLNRISSNRSNRQESSMIRSGGV